MTRFHDKAIHLRNITVVVAGDIVVFVAFVLFGKVEHEVTLSQAFFRTTLPFGIVWLSGSPWLGAYKASTLYNPKTTIWKIPVSWFLCGSGGLFARTLITGQPVIMSFALVAITVQGMLLLLWRGIFLITICRWSRQ